MVPSNTTASAPQTTAAAAATKPSVDRAAAAPLPSSPRALPTIAKDPPSCLTTEALFTGVSLGKQLGQGHFSVVFSGSQIVNRATGAKPHPKLGEAVAVKRVDKARLTKKDAIALRAEVAILSSIAHPRIIGFSAWYEDDRFYWLVTELVQGGELFDKIASVTYYEESDARRLVYVLASTLKFLHDCKCVHRDLKPENILLANAEDDASIKLADFGFARVVPPELLSTSCGTPNYVAPEVISGLRYGVSADVWSLGVISYVLCAGYPPFSDASQVELFRRIRRGQYQFDSPWWDPVSDTAKDFVARCLTVDMNKRPTIAQVLDHPWLASPRQEDGLNDLTQTARELRVFNARRRLRGFFRAAILSNQLAEVFAKARAKLLVKAHSA